MSLTREKLDVCDRAAPDHVGPGTYILLVNVTKLKSAGVSPAYLTCSLLWVRIAFYVLVAV